MDSLKCGRFDLPLGRPLIMGILNVTPDSFSDGGLSAHAHAAIARAHDLFESGADLVDIGGESTRPGAETVSVEEELARIVPVLDGLRNLHRPVSVDTRKPEVMRIAIDHGAAMINDVNALLADGAMDVVARSDVAVCLMHMNGTPQTMQDDPRYVDVVDEVRDFLASRVRTLERAGVGRSRIAVDPGFGFGKSVEHNLELLRRLDAFAELGCAVMVGLSRKATLGRITGRAVNERVFASVAAALIAVSNGANILRVHDVAATRDVLAVWQAVTFGGVEQ